MMSTQFTPPNFNGRQPPHQFPAILDNKWNPSPTFCHIADAIFIHLDQNYGLSSQRNSGRLEFQKILDLQNLLVGAGEIAKAPYVFWARLYHELWVAEGVGHSMIEDTDGLKHPVFDRSQWIGKCVRDWKCNPNAQHEAWNVIIAMFHLKDPVTGVPFPSPLPRGVAPLNTLHPIENIQD
ncbi:hypothetical protein DL93DRAFT_2174372 [Clavulina sp. PMI_390]|nr:hypothetical protein DL93DRAFT_2174372 [Clavulina sp. PMI_390]